MTAQSVIMVRVAPHNHGIRPNEPLLENGVMRVDTGEVLLAVRANLREVDNALNEFCSRHIGMERTLSNGEVLVRYEPYRWQTEQAKEAMFREIENHLNVARIKSGTEATPYGAR